MNENFQLKESFYREDFVDPIVGIGFLLVFLFLVFTLYNFREYVKTILLSNISIKSFTEVKSVESNKNKKASLWLNLFFLMVLSMMGYSFIISETDYTSSLNHFEKLFTSIGVVGFLFVFKYIFKKALGIVFRKEYLTSISYTHLSIKDKVFGLIVFPFLVIYNFSLPLKEISLIIIVLISCFYLFLRWINAFLVGIKDGNVPYFYSFLYICTLEIIPVIIALKVFSKPILSILA
tara:strand:+ start:322 stop:1026 length:705 start_codon:yes stop_codon:yes gene_type:complete